MSVTCLLKRNMVRRFEADMREAAKSRARERYLRERYIGRSKVPPNQLSASGPYYVRDDGDTTHVIAPASFSGHGGEFSGAGASSSWDSSSSCSDSGSSSSSSDPGTDEGETNR